VRMSSASEPSVTSDKYLYQHSSDEEGGDDKEVDSNDPEEMFQNIQYQKEIIANIRSRPWPMRRKLKVLKQAREIVLKYEGQLTRTRGYQTAGADWSGKFVQQVFNVFCSLSKEAQTSLSPAILVSFPGGIPRRSQAS
uniref:Uncharacterized protein n=1 Tax=Poecilia mexicana TaxID=48701 RepID=A0A3B3YXJ7_9TELE